MLYKTIFLIASATLASCQFDPSSVPSALRGQPLPESRIYNILTHPRGLVWLSNICLSPSLSTNVWCIRQPDKKHLLSCKPFSFSVFTPLTDPGNT